MTGPLLGPLLLPPDVTITPVAQLPAQLRGQLEQEPDEHCVTRPNARTASTIVDSAGAALLAEFRQPTTIADAVLAFSLANGVDPAETLEEAFALLSGFINDGVLVVADSALAAPIGTGLRPAERIGGYTVHQPVQVLVDTEVHRGSAADGSPVAVKLARPGFGAQVRAQLDHEASVLARLAGVVSPALLDAGEYDDRPYLVTAWVAGVDLHRAATGVRRLPGSARRNALLDLADRVLAAYAHLHGAGVLHGDVHPRNVLVTADDRVTLVDFGLAATIDADGTVRAVATGGVDLYREPELSGARRPGGPTGLPTAAGEQYSVARLVYLILTGGQPYPLALTDSRLPRRPPAPFAEHGVADLPAVQRTVRRALADRPSRRYPSVADFRTALRTAAARDRRAPASDSSRSGQQLVDDVLARLTRADQRFEDDLVAPVAPVMNGAAGLGYALLEIAAEREDAELLAGADRWATRALLASGDERAYVSDELEINPASVGERSFYHSITGVHAVQALIADARGDELGCRLAAADYLAVAQSELDPARRGPGSGEFDLAFGRSGLLLGCAVLVQRLADPDATDLINLVALGDALRDALWRRLAQQPPLDRSAELRTLGVAHGWAGYLYALLCWSAAAGTAPPYGVAERLAELAAQAVPAGRGVYWAYQVGGPAPDPGLGTSWCNGTAGYVHLWNLAHEQYGEAAYARLARQAAFSTFDATGARAGDLCCGSAGRAYALLCQYRHSGEPAWLNRARALTGEAVAGVRRGTMRRDSLYKGDVGTAVLVAQLAHPDHARMPLFELAGPAGCGRAVQSG
ncbi:lanthionine synthetase LanC family protein [Micromonospora sp. NPDC005215]|uniref:lanthionine synthetase LanC family protein n=1 Tax=Micromonospora sp. NPDC005215 TaxID=3157024 RepID=UPI0033A9229F